MNAKLWNEATDSHGLFDWVMKRSPRTKRPTRKIRLFLCASCHSLSDQPLAGGLADAVSITEQFADSLISRSALTTVRSRMNRDGIVLGTETDYERLCLWLVSPDSSLWGATKAVIDLCTLLRLREQSETPPAVYSGEWNRAILFERKWLTPLLRDIFPNPFRPVAFDPVWRTPTAVALASQMYESRDFGAVPILADALQDAGCDNEEVLNHCRGPGPHVRGCWVVDLVLGKE